MIKSHDWIYELFVKEYVVKGNKIKPTPKKTKQSNLTSIYIKNL
jgi:hypothetical protein|tara:strand:+ start:554 stop:685 length:132 start_codon:yes stop_codon:yes gene_type:complete